MAIAPLIEGVHGFDDAIAGNYDFAILVGGRWCATDPTSNAPDLTNFEYVHQSLVLQAVIDAPYQTDQAVSHDKIEGRVTPLRACASQAEVKNSFHITTKTTSLTSSSNM
jgi:hypothetical protein